MLYPAYFYIPPLAVLYTLHKEMNTLYAVRGLFVVNFVAIFAFLFAPFQWIVALVVYTASIFYFWG